MTGLAVVAHVLDDPDASVALVWVPSVPARMVASGPLGGGVGDRCWVVNVTVPADYARLDPDAHLRAVAATLGLEGPGVGMLTAVRMSDARHARDGGVDVMATVGVSWPTWAAAPDGDPNPYAGTVNVLAWVPVPLADAALVNAVITVTEAKAQALFAAGVPGTGTASDAVCVACPATADGDDGEPFAGPRSPWGARLARAVHTAVAAGLPPRREGRRRRAPAPP